MAAAREMAQRARAASRKLQAMTTDERVAMLNRVADALEANAKNIMEENAKASASNRKLFGTRVMKFCCMPHTVQLPRPPLHARARTRTR